MKTIVVWGVLSPDGDKEVRLGGVGRPGWYRRKGKKIYRALKAALASAVMESLVREVLAEHNYKLIIFDADGTLRRCTVEGQPCPNKPGEWALMPNVEERLTKIAWGDPRDGRVAYGVVSNQAGVGYGYLTARVAWLMLRDTFFVATHHFPATGTIRMCPHKAEEGCACRKPQPLMLQKAMSRWRVSPGDTLYVGDMESDREAAENAGCDFMWARDFFGWED